MGAGRLAAHQEKAQALGALIVFIGESGFSLVRKYAERHPRLHLEALPAYAPELNPVEGLWAHFKAQTLANASPRDVEDLIQRVSEASAQVQPPRLNGFIPRAGLPL